MRRAALVLSLFASALRAQRAPSAAAAPPAVPLLGDWQLNLARTHYGPTVDRRRRERFSCDAQGGGVRCVITSVRADGQELIGGFVATVDGAVAPVTGIPDTDAVR